MSDPTPNRNQEAETSPNDQAPPTLATASPSQASPAAPSAAVRLLKLIYNHNPFYLISVGCLLHGSGFWFRGGTGAHEPWQLMALICGFILLLDVTAFVIVRWGKVWDDARTILLTLLVLFAVLALTFDDTLLIRPAIGQGLLIGGFLFCTLVTEGLLLGLGIRLGALYRVPYYILLALLFLYPVALQPGATTDAGSLTWRIWAFSPLAAAGLLTLLPAIRRSRSYVAENGTPWAWPLFPWCVFLFLGAAVLVRGYALSLSFDPVLTLGREAALNFGTAFGGWFLVPAVLAIAALLLEIGLVERIRSLQRLALLGPAVALWMAFPSAHASEPFRDFLSQFRDAAGSPPFWTACLAATFYLVAVLRRVPFAQEGLIAALVALCVIGPATVGPKSLIAIQAWPLVVIALFQGVMACTRRNSYRAALAAVAAVAAVRFQWGSLLSPLACDLLWMAGTEAALVAVAWSFRDAFARFLRPLTAWLFLVTSVWAQSEPYLFAPSHFESAVPLVVLVTSAAGVWLSYRLGSLAWYVIGGLTGFISAWQVSLDVYRVLKSSPGPWNVDALLWGAASFLIAAAISAWKAGWLQRWLQAFPGPPDPLEALDR